MKNKELEKKNPENNLQEEKKQGKNTAVELNDDALENVNGGSVGDILNSLSPQDRDIALLLVWRKYGHMTNMSMTELLASSIVSEEEILKLLEEEKKLRNSRKNTGLLKPIIL